MGFSFPPNATTGTSFTQMEPVLTPQQLRERYLFGIKLQDVNGNDLPDATIQYHINAAISYLEHKLDLIILERKFEEDYDYRAVDYTQFNFIQLKKRPLSSVESIKAQFPNNTTLVEYPPSWYVLEKEGAQIQLSPIEGSFSGLIVTQGGSYVPLIYGTRDYWPHMFRVNYTAGFCKDAIPLLLNEMIGMQAAIRIFEILGDAIFGPGLSSNSVSLDGAAITRQLTASANYSIFAARVTNYKDQMKDYIETAKAYYKGIPSIIA